MPGFDAVILGSGVIGLSIALELHARGLRVAVVAKDLPEDVESAGWASPWAGCNWYPFDRDGSKPESVRERATFAHLVELAKARPDLCERIPFYNVWDREKPEGAEEWFIDLVGDYKSLPASAPTPGNKRFAHTWTSFIMHAPNYMAYLAQQCRAAHIPLVRRRLSSLAEAYAVPELGGPGSAGLVINASGLGARSLLGVEDEKVYPARGQTVLVRAKMERVCVMSAEDFYTSEDPAAGPAYIIPRPGPTPCGPGYTDVILGGTYLPNNYSPLPDRATAERILRECHALLPALAPPEGTWRDIKVISHNVGLRPAREGGARVELERLDSRVGGDGDGNGGEGRRAVIHAYGFGSAGYQQSIGAAVQVADIVDDAGLNPSKRPRAKL